MELGSLTQAEQRLRIESSAELKNLDKWLRRAATVDKTDQLFAP